MNYDYIENLVKQCKDGDETSKEKLIEEFRPFIINLSKRTFIPGYDYDDFKNECYRILFLQKDILLNYLYYLHMDQHILHFLILLFFSILVEGSRLSLT